ncbi:MAG: glycosyltransferase [Actinomycetota bacterium]|nr:glycosyltransferase [Actinomycetota bacterium]
MAPAASVIVRAKNEERLIGRTLESLRRQTVVPEVIVIDSGSTDRTVAIARERCDRLIEIPPELFSYGFALNLGARTASAPIHFALSAHCVAERPDWVERSLAHYERDDVAGTNGPWPRSEAEAPRILHQDIAHALENPHLGFSNHASSWRAAVWERFPFDESLRYAEDKEWALRVLEAGWIIVSDPALRVDMSHVWRSGYAELYRRQKRAAQELRRFTSAEYTLRDLASEWWARGPGERRSRPRRLLNPLRLAGLTGKYHGYHWPRRAPPLR